MPEPQTLWGFPIVIREDWPKGEVVFGPMPTAEDIARHGSYEAAVEAMKRSYAKQKTETLSADILD
jgi:hypothetical protein